MPTQPTLDDVANAFHIWRTTKRGGQAIPSELWDKVAAVANRHTMSKICQQLRVSYSQYRGHVIPRISNTTDNLISAPPRSVEFINVTPLIAEQVVEQKSPMVLEFIRRDGLSAKCHCPDSVGGQNMLAWFLRGE